MVEKDNIAGTKTWDVSTTEKLESLWRNIVEQQSWVSFGIEKLSTAALEEAKQGFTKRMLDLRNDYGFIVGNMKQYIVVAALRSK
jgi:hypothetical protein